MAGKRSCRTLTTLVIVAAALLGGCRHPFRTVGDAFSLVGRTLSDISFPASTNNYFLPVNLYVAPSSELLADTDASSYSSQLPDSLITIERDYLDNRQHGLSSKSFLYADPYRRPILSTESYLGYKLHWLADPFEPGVARCVAPATVCVGGDYDASAGTMVSDYLILAAGCEAVSWSTNRSEWALMSDARMAEAGLLGAAVILQKNGWPDHLIALVGRQAIPMRRKDGPIDEHQEIYSKLIGSLQQDGK